MGIIVTDNFSPKTPKFIDDRQSFETLEEMKNCDINLLPEGFETYCVETNKKYKFLSSNSIDVNLGKWRLVEGGAAEEVYFTTTSPVTNKVGEFDLAEEITEADKMTLNEAINRILHLNVDPEATLEVTKMTTLMEIGQSVQNPQLRLVFTSLGNATVTNIQFLKNDVEINNQTFVDGTTEYKYDDINTVSSNVVYKAVITYNFGKGDKTLIKTFRTDFVRKTFYGTTNQDTFDLTSDNIRSLSGSKLGVKKGDKININITQGSTEVILAYPSILGDVTSIKYVEAFNTEVSDVFVKNTVSVQDVNGTNPTVYNVYVYRPDLVFTQDVNYSVEI